MFGKKSTRQLRKSYGVMPYGRRLTSLAVVVVHPLALFASTLSSSKRRNENVANEKDTCGVRAIHPRPEGRGFPRIPIKPFLFAGFFTGAEDDACSSWIERKECSNRITFTLYPQFFHVAVSRPVY